MSILPRAAEPFVTFPALLRANGFAVAPEQTTTFLAAIGLLGPKSVDDIRRAAHATLAPPPERHAAFDALFGAHFLGEMEEGEALRRARRRNRAGAGRARGRIRAAALR